MKPEEAIACLENELRTRDLPQDHGLIAVKEILRLAKAFLELEYWLDNLPTTIISMTPDFVLKKITKLKEPPAKTAFRDDLYRVKAMVEDLLNERCYNTINTHRALDELNGKIDNMLKER